jgi:hypothetical protein
VQLFLVKKEHSHDFKSVVLLQECMGLIKDEPDSGSEACVTTVDDGTEEFSIEVQEAEMKVGVSDIKIEVAIDMKEENPGTITFPPIKGEPEVSVWGLCVMQLQFVLPRPFTYLLTYLLHGAESFLRS